MARLPDVQQFGPRPVPRPQRGMVQVSPGTGAGADAMARALQGAGRDLTIYGIEQLDREATAAAKDRDALVSEQIRTLMYDPESGFANLRGQSAVEKRASVMEQLDKIATQGGEGLNRAASEKVSDTIRRRVESAKLTVDSHTAGERLTWLNGASAARMESAYQDSLVNPAQTQAAVNLITGEIRGTAAREGWDAERTAMETEKAVSKVYSGQIERVASVSPVDAMQLLRQNEGKMLSSDVVAWETRLTPAVKQYVGRERGREAFASTGDMTGAMQVAASNLGMSETSQNQAISEYLRDGGVNLDPAVTAWCAAYVNASLARAGYSGTGSLAARSFLNWGEDVSQPKRGDIVVLSRGNDPTKGHVGFVDGINDDGSVRVLGGNQGDAVSIKSFPASQVLGYRRAPDTANTTQALRTIMDIEDPEERDAAIAEFNMRVSVSEQQAKQNREAAGMKAHSIVEQGGDLDSELTLADKQMLGPGAMSGLRSYQAQMRSNGYVTTNDETYYSLRQMAVNEPDRFRALDLNQYRGELDEGDWKTMIDLQTARPKTDVNPVAASTLMSTAKPLIAAAGIDTSPKEGTDAAATVAGIQSNLIRWQDKFIAENGRVPNQSEISQRANELLLPVVMDPPGLMNKREGTVLDAMNWTQADLGRMVTSGVTIGGKQIPPEQVNAAIEYLQANGEDLSPENIFELLTGTLMQAGAL